MKVIILAGGSGTRLWPVSRQEYPKQFLTLGGEKSLFQETVARACRLVSPQEIVIVTQARHLSHIQAQLGQLGQEVGKIVVEPQGKNSGPAILLGVAAACEQDVDDELYLVLSADHVIEEGEAWQQAVEAAQQAARSGKIVVFGLEPITPETGYGYIQKGKCTPCGYEVRRFVEKPDRKTAEQYVASQEYFWNAGIFAFALKTLYEEVARWLPDLFVHWQHGYEPFLKAFDQLPAISFDYAVMEKTDQAFVVPLEASWRDVGSWESVWELLEKDNANNASLGDVHIEGSQDSLFWGDQRLIAALGVEGLVVVDTHDVLLVAKKEQAQSIRTIVDKLHHLGRREVKEHRWSCRPWGKYAVLSEENRYKVKKITVGPGHILSLQRHYHRSEHWVVVKGTAKVRIGDQETHVHENESIYVPKGAVHRVENPGRVPLEIIEVQVGEYLGEDDIVRLEDVYGRLS